jgi:pimeloyl-ACP methyl ester carboxylesterase
MSKRSRKAISPEERLKEFGFEFVDDKLVQRDDHSLGFQFVDQQHYDQLADLITELVYAKMEAIGLERMSLGEEEECPMFVSPRVAAATRVVVLLHGSNNRAGLWSRKLCINETLTAGSMLAYIQRCLDNDWGVVVLNHSLEFKIGHTKVDNAFTHVEYIWDHLLSSFACQQFALVAHSFGGSAAFHLMCARQAILTRLVAVAFTDSVHNLTAARKHEFTLPKAFLASAGARNWVKSSKRLDAAMAIKGGCRCVSAGHAVHEWASASAIESVFVFLKAQFERRHVPVRSSTAQSADA